LQILRQLEESLHRHEVRTQTDQLTLLLHSSFMEIGYSGESYNFNTIVNALEAEAEPEFVIWSQQYQFIEIAPGVCQVLYLQARMDKAGKLSRHAKRSSIWIETKVGWQMKFHQGTPTNAFSKQSL